MSLLGTICMKFQTCFLGKVKNKSKCCLLNYLSSRQNVKIRDLCLTQVISKGKGIGLNLNLYHSLGKFSRRQINDIVLLLPRKQGLIVHAKICFLGKNQNKNISICCLLIFFCSSISVVSCCRVLIVVSSL